MNWTLATTRLLVPVNKEHKCVVAYVLECHVSFATTASVLKKEFLLAWSFIIPLQSSLFYDVLHRSHDNVMSSGSLFKKFEEKKKWIQLKLYIGNRFESMLSRQRKKNNEETKVIMEWFGRIAKWTYVKLCVKWCLTSTEYFLLIERKCHGFD